MKRKASPEILSLRASSIDRLVRNVSLNVSVYLSTSSAIIVLMQIGAEPKGSKGDQDNMTRENDNDKHFRVKGTSRAVVPGDSYI